MYLISDTALSKVQLPYSPPDFHHIRNQPQPLPTDLENVLDFRFKPVQSTTSLLPDRFSPNSPPTLLPFANYIISKIYLISGSDMSKVHFSYSNTIPTFVFSRSECLDFSISKFDIH